MKALTSATARKLLKMLSSPQPIHAFYAANIGHFSIKRTVVSGGKKMLSSEVNFMHWSIFFKVEKWSNGAELKCSHSQSVFQSN